VPSARQDVATLTSSSHEVEPRFDVQSTRRYRIIGSAIPLRRFSGLEGFPAQHLGIPSLQTNARAVPALALFSRVSPDLIAASRSRQPALMGFGPLQRHQSWRHGSLGFASPDTFRLQGFSPSCRFASSSTFRPCFMPVTLVGFSLQGFFPSQSLARPLGCGDLRDVSARNERPSRNLKDASNFGTPSTRLYSLRRSDTCGHGVNHAGGRCPPGFRLTSREFPLAPAHRLRGGSPRGLRLRR
jgi:hypothetical protein